MKLEGKQQMTFQEVPEQDRVYSKTKKGQVKFAFCQKSTKLPFFCKRSSFRSVWWNSRANFKIAGHVEQHALDLDLEAIYANCGDFLFISKL